MVAPALRRAWRQFACVWRDAAARRSTWQWEKSFRARAPFITLALQHMFRLDKKTLITEAKMKAAYDSTGKQRQAFATYPDMAADPVAMMERLVVAATTSLRVATRK